MQIEFEIAIATNNHVSSVVYYRRSNWNFCQQLAQMQLLKKFGSLWHLLQFALTLSGMVLLGIVRERGARGGCNIGGTLLV